MNIFRWSKQRPIVVYLIFANVFTWVGWIPTLIISSQQGNPLPVLANYREWFQTGFSNPQQIIRVLACNLAVYESLLAAIIATWLEKGKDGLAELWGQIIKWRVAGRCSDALSVTFSRQKSSTNIKSSAFSPYPIVSISFPVILIAN